MAKDELTLSDFCAQHRLTLDLTALYYFSHWFTPPSAPRRFDTRFFIARLPALQEADAHDYEVVSGALVDAS